MRGATNRNSGVFLEAWLEWQTLARNACSVLMEKQTWAWRILREGSSPSASALNACVVMTNEEKEKILEKIRKLLNLKESARKVGNEGEAYAAAKGVRRLLLKYNLSMADVGDGETKENIDIGETDYISYNDKYGYWKRGLLQVLCEFNFCQGLIQTGLKSFSIVGERQNIIVVRQLFEYLAATFKHLASEKFRNWLFESAQDVAEYAAVKGKWIPFDYLVDAIKKKEHRTFFRSYYKGAVDGLYEQYRQMQATSEEKALVVTYRNAIDEFLKTMDNYSGKTFHERKKKPTLYADAYFKGVKDGENVSLSPQLKRSQHQILEAK